MVIKGYTTLPRSPKLELHCQMQFCVIHRSPHLVRGAWFLKRLRSVYSKSRRRGVGFIQDISFQSNAVYIDSSQQVQSIKVDNDTIDCATVLLFSRARYPQEERERERERESERKREENREREKERGKQRERVSQLRRKAQTLEDHIYG